MTEQTLAQEVFGDPDSEWHQVRKVLEGDLVRAAAALLAHTSAASITIPGAITVEVKQNELH